MALGKTIAFVGAGNMAEALVKGLLRAHVAEPHEIVCSDRREERGPELAQRYGVRITRSNREAVEQADVIVLSVKPQVMNKLLVEIAPALSQRKLVISIAAGVPIAAIERKVGHGVRIIRTMPNTPALVGAGGDRDDQGTALALAAQTGLGSAKLLIETGDHPGRLKDQVTSPGGTAIAGLHTLEAGGLRTTLMDAVEAATNRSRELGERFLEQED